MDCRCVEKWRVRVSLLDQHDDLGAALDDPLCTVRHELLDNTQELLPRCIAHLAEAQLVVDDPVHDFTVGGTRYDDLDALLRDGRDKSPAPS